MFFFECCSRWERRCSLGARHLVGADVGCVNRRSVAGEWLLWFALGGGPPDFWKVPGLPAAIGLGPVPGGVWDPPPGTEAVVYPAVSVLSPLSMMICSTSLAVYPQRTSWFR